MILLKTEWQRKLFKNSFVLTVLVLIIQYIIIFLIIAFSITFVIIFFTMMFWTFVFYGILEDMYFELMPSGNYALILFFLFNLVFTLLIVIMAIYISIKSKNKMLFWILYFLFIIAFFLVTAHIFRGFVI